MKLPRPAPVCFGHASIKTPVDLTGTFRVFDKAPQKLFLLNTSIFLGDYRSMNRISLGRYRLCKDEVIRCQKGAFDCVPIIIHNNALIPYGHECTVDEVTVLIGYRT